MGAGAECQRPGRGEGGRGAGVGPFSVCILVRTSLWQLMHGWGGRPVAVNGNGRPPPLQRPRPSPCETRGGPRTLRSRRGASGEAPTGGGPHQPGRAAFALNLDATPPRGPVFHLQRGGCPQGPDRGVQLALTPCGRAPRPRRRPLLVSLLQEGREGGGGVVLRARGHRPGHLPLAPPSPLSPSGRLHAPAPERPCRAQLCCSRGLAPEAPPGDGAPLAPLRGAGRVGPRPFFVFYSSAAAPGVEGTPLRSVLVGEGRRSPPLPPPSATPLPVRRLPHPPFPSLCRHATAHPVGWRV